MERYRFSLGTWAPLLLLVLMLCSCRDRGELADEAAATHGVTDTEITLGSSLALTGHAGYLGTQNLSGAQAYIHQINSEGGVYGRNIRIVALDDAYDPPRCLVNTQKFIVDGNVFALFCYVGTPTTVKVLPLVDEARIPLLGVLTGANALRDPFNRYVVNIRASYYQETEAVVDHLINDLGIRDIAVFYQYDAYGFDGLVGTELALKRYGLEPVARGSYIRGTLDVEEGLARIRDSGAQAVVMVGTSGACARFIDLSVQDGFDPIFYNVSFVGAEDLAKRLGPECPARVVMSQVVPPPDHDGQVPEGEDLVEREYVRTLRRYCPGELPSFAGLEGYLNARILVEGLRRAGPDLTREKFIDAIESIQDYHLEFGATIRFGPGDHQGMDRVYFTLLNGERFMEFEDWAVLKR